MGKHPPHYYFSVFLNFARWNKDYLFNNQTKKTRANKHSLSISCLPATLGAQSLFKPCNKTTRHFSEKETQAWGLGAAPAGGNRWWRWVWAVKASAPPVASGLSLSQPQASEQHVSTTSLNKIISEGLKETGIYLLFRISQNVYRTSSVFIKKHVTYSKGNQNSYF